MRNLLQAFFSRFIATKERPLDFQLMVFLIVVICVSLIIWSVMNHFMPQVYG